MVKINNMKTSAEFISKIEIMMASGKYEGYMEAVIEYCEKNNLDVETAAALLKTSTKIKSKIQKEAEGVNLLPKTSNLGI